MFSVTLEDGKYTVHHEHGTNFRALRYGETWRDLTGDGLVLALVQEIERLQTQAVRLMPIDGYQWLVAAVDAAMIEMRNIVPPLRRSECERLICAALGTHPEAKAWAWCNYDILTITTAYEQGFGHAWREELSNPYKAGTKEYVAWDMGCGAGKKQTPKPGESCTT